MSGGASRSWRGEAEVDRDEAAERLTSGSLGGGAGRLLRDLLRPYRRALQVLVLIVLVENTARLAIPYLVKVGIDSGIPPIRERDDLSTLLTVVAVVLVATVTQAVARNRFLVRQGEIGQDVLLALRRRVFGHFQVLSPAFHDGYTSGRVISRQTSDVDAIHEMLETGFDGLVTAALTLVGTAGILLFLDVRLGLVALLCGPFLALLTNWFRKASADSYRVTREKVALVIVHFVESMGGVRAVQAFRREERNQEIFDDVNDQYRRANLVAFRLVAWFMPGIRLIGNITIAVVLLYGGYLAYRGEVTVGVLAAFLLYLRQFFEPMMEISQFYNTFQSASAALEKLAGVLEQEPDVPEPAAPATAGPGRGRAALRRGALRVRRGPPGAAGPRPARARRADGRAGRHHRGRQDHAGQAGHPVLRPDRGPGAARRHRRARPGQRHPARPRGDGDPGELPVLGHHRRQHPLRAPRRDDGGGRGRHHRAGRPRLHRRHAATATRPTWPTRVGGSRPASASWSPSPARSWPTRRC